jgi:hypothetical protein
MTTDESTNGEELDEKACALQEALFMLDIELDDDDICVCTCSSNCRTDISFRTSEDLNRFLAVARLVATSELLRRMESESGSEDDWAYYAVPYQHNPYGFRVHVNVAFPNVDLLQLADGLTALTSRAGDKLPTDVRE